MALVKFLRGLESKYNQTAHKDGIYFATDTGHIYVNGVLYGGDSEVKVSDVVVADSVITVSYTDGNSKTFDLVSLIAAATETSAGLMSAEDKKTVNEIAAGFSSGNALLSGEQAQVIAKVQSGAYDNLVDGVVESDKVLSLNDKVLSATVSLSYDENNKKIVLLGKDSVELGSVDATPFIKDGMLDDVDIVEASEENPVGENTAGKYIVFTWKVQDGETKTDFIPVSDLAQTYTAGTAVEITGSNEIGVVIAEGTNYLVNDNGLKVSEMGADVTRTTDAIQIAGGPLANNIADSSDVWPDGWYDEAGNKIIPEGKSVQEILAGLFLKVVYGTVTWGTPSWSPSLGNPVVTLSSNGPVEVGSSVTIKSTASGTATAGNRTATCTATQGYFDTVDGSYVSGNKTVSVAGSISGDVSFAYTWNDVTVASDASLEVKEGTNTVKVTQSGQTAVCEALPTTTVYASTNTKTVLDNVSATLTDTKPSDVALSKTGTDTITGAYYAFVGYVDALPTTSAEIRALNANSRLGKGSAGTANTVYTIDKNYMIVALPSGWDFTIQNSLGQDAQRNSFENIGNIDVVLPNGTNKSYVVYSIGWKDGQYKNLVIK